MASDGQVRASHILIKHQGSRRPVSWKDPEGYVITNTTRDSAVSQVKAKRDDIVSGKAKFQDIASRYSDCSSAKRGGDLGPFSRGQMQKPFEEATYSLRVGELSDTVDTDSGVHIIMRTGLVLIKPEVLIHMILVTFFSFCLPRNNVRICKFVLHMKLHWLAFDSNFIPGLRLNHRGTNVMYLFSYQDSVTSLL